MDRQWNVAIESSDLLGEGPWWSVVEQALWRVDIVAQRVHRWEPLSGAARTYELPAKVGCFVPCADGRHGLAALPDGVHLLDLVTSELTLVVPLEDDVEDNLFNDGKCDRAGNFWVGSKHATDEPSRGALYRIDANGHAQRLLTGITTSNGIGWSPDGSICYYTDSGARTIWRMTVDAEGMKTREVFVEDTAGVPDGLTVDAEGCVWSAKWDGARVVRYGPDGRVDRTIELSISRPTSVMFGGASLTELYITSARVGVESEPLAGHVFVAETDTRGLPETPAAFPK